MNKIIKLATIALCFSAMINQSNAQETALPKGIEMYSTEHTDPIGISGKYYLKYDIYFEAKKSFQLNAITIEYRPEEYTGTIHYIKEEAKKGVRYSDADETKEVDLEIMDGPTIGKINVEKNNYYSFPFQNKLMPGRDFKQGFKNGVVFYRYSQDPEIILVANASSQTKDGKKVLRLFDTDTKTFLGGSMNVMCKKKEKLADWDSTKLANAVFHEFMMMVDNSYSAMGDAFDLPPQVTKDVAREKEYFNLIKPVATNDKPESWGDRMDYVYIAKDWKTMYRKDNPSVISHRTALIVAISHGWKNNECRFIYCTINQPWDGKAFGAAFMAGFNGSLGPISCKKAQEFKH
jgi:hypothetical protein